MLSNPPKRLPFSVALGTPTAHHTTVASSQLPLQRASNTLGQQHAEPATRWVSDMLG